MTARLQQRRPADTIRPAARTAWLILAVLLLFSIAAPLNQFKVPPIMPLLMDAFRLSVGRAGLLMSIFAVTGLILALPSGFIFQRAGLRTTGLLAGGAIIIGAAWGALSTTEGSLLASRVIEGIGTSFMAVLAPAIIAQWFTAQRRGTAMGIWAAWVPIGSSVMLIAAPALAQSAHWPAVWWFGGIYALLVTVLYLVFVKPAPAAGREPASTPLQPAGAAPVALPTAGPAQVLRNRNLWLLSIAFAAFNMVTISSATFMPTFLNQVRGLTLGQAGLLASIPSVMVILSAPAGGMLSDRLGSRKLPYVVGFVLLALIAPLAAFLGLPALIAVVVLQGLFAGPVAANIFSAAVETVGERQGGLAMAVIMVGQNAGQLLGPLVFGALVESSAGWPLAFASLAIMGLLGTLAGWLTRIR